MSGGIRSSTAVRAEYVRKFGPAPRVVEVGVKDLVIEGERLYYSSAHPEGVRVGDGETYSLYGPVGPIPAWEVTHWLPNGYKGYENTVAHGSVVHQWTWTMPEYPGKWYGFAKGPIFDMTPSSYRFTVPENVGSDPLGQGWRA